MLSLGIVFLGLSRRRKLLAVRVSYLNHGAPQHRNRVRSRSLGRIRQNDDRIIVADGDYIAYVAPQFVRTTGTINCYTFNHMVDVTVERNDSTDREASIEGLFAGAPVDGACEAIVSGYFE